MNKYELVVSKCIFLFLLCPAFVLAQNVKGPKMVIKERVFDFKGVNEGETIEHTFLILNKGDQPLEIKKIKHS